MYGVGNLYLLCQERIANSDGLQKLEAWCNLIHNQILFLEWISNSGATHQKGMQSRFCNPVIAILMMPAERYGPFPWHLQEGDWIHVGAWYSWFGFAMELPLGRSDSISLKQVSRSRGRSIRWYFRRHAVPMTSIEMKYTDYGLAYPLPYHIY